MSDVYKPPESSPENATAVPAKPGGLRGFRAKFAFWVSFSIFSALFLAVIPFEKWLFIPVASAFAGAFTAAIAALLPIRSFVANTVASIFLMLVIGFFLGLAQMR